MTRTPSNIEQAIIDGLAEQGFSHWSENTDGVMCVWADGGIETEELAQYMSDAVDSQEIKSRHWKELLDALAEMLNDPEDPHSGPYALDVEFGGRWEVYASCRDDSSGDSYDELYAALGLI